MTEEDPEVRTSDDEATVYTIRLRPRASRDLDIEATRLADQDGDEVALDWLAKIKQAIMNLSIWPRRFPLAPEEELIEHGVRVLLFRRIPRGQAWRVFFTVDDGDGVFLVRVRHIRHAASPLTEHDTQELLSDA